MFRTQSLRITLVALVFLIGLPTLASAAGHFDFYGGYRFSGSANVDDAFTGGFRGGFHIAPHLEFEFTAGWTDFTAFLPNSRIDGNLYLFDASLVASPADGPFYVLAGIGGAEADFRVRGIGGGSYWAWETSFTMNGGLGFRIPLGPGPVYLRPEARARWIEKVSDFDYELTMAIGFGR